MAESYYQSKTVTGKVTDAVSKEPLVGASVWIKETTIGVIVDINGNYSIQADNPAAILVFSHVGYATQEIIVGNRAVVDVELEASSMEIEEVVVVGYGTQKKESVVGAISSVKPAELVMPTAHVSNILAGQVNGVIVIQRSGEPGSHAEFWIRGVNTTKSENNPLVLVDGIERSLDHVDVEDIESVSVLKDASATAIYGVRGANGVIIVTTRKGKEGAPRISVNAYTGIIQPTKLPKFADAYEFADYYNEAFGYNNNGRSFYTDEAMQKYKDNSDPDLYPDVNWIDEIFKDYSMNRRVSANVSGGGTIARYFISGSYYNEGSIYKTDNMKTYDSSIQFNKFNFRANVDIDLSKTTMLIVNLANIYETKVEPGGENIWRNAFEISPNAMPVRFSDGTLSTVAGLPIGYGNPYNTLTQCGYINRFWNTAQALIGFREDLKYITQGLSANAKFSWDAHNSTALRYIGSPNSFEAQGRDEDGNLILTEISKGSNTLDYSREQGGTRTFYLEAAVNYNRIFADKHRVTGLLLYNLRSHRLMNDASANRSIPFRNQGIAGRVTYAYHDRYFTEFNFGYNGSENFSPDNRYGFFPSIALGWMISEEEFFEPIKQVVNMLKIRASYGLVGNDNIGGSRRFIYNPTFVSGGGVYAYQNGYNPGFIRAGDIANDHVSWEECNKLDIGLEAGLFKGLKIQADYFEERREGIFMQRDDMSFTAGLTVNPWTNVGKVSNKGFDLQGEYFQPVNHELSVSMRGNFTYNHNQIIENAQPKWNYAYRERRMRPIGQTIGLIADGLFTSQEEIDNSPKHFGEVRVGDIKYRDLNGDGVITNWDETSIGYSWLPEIVYSGGASIRWKNLDFSFLLQGVTRVSTMMGGRAMQPFRSGSITTSGFFRDVYEKGWKLNNQDPNAVYPRAYVGDFENNTKSSTYWLRDAGYLRVKDVTLGYTVPKAFTSKIRLQSVRVYLNAVNLFTFSKIKLFDPEISNDQGAGYPPSRIISFGLNIHL
ncbi:MAG: TonB-dependent receptor [Bacteroidales bacterium]|nr:TonB-dependent receptor [Bacteroidales bacterium]